eukprot:10365441-Alexandrium_andersonii.AAC.1
MELAGAREELGRRALLEEHAELRLRARVAPEHLGLEAEAREEGADRGTLGRRAHAPLVVAEPPSHR